MRRETVGRKSGAGGRRNVGVVGACALFTSVALGSLVVGLGTLDAAPREVRRENQDPGCLWKIVLECVGHSPGQCMYVDTTNQYAVLEEKQGAHYLVLPTMRVRGIDDPRVLQADFPNYFFHAFEEAERHLNAPREQVGLVIDSVAGRDQDQMHLHVACVRSEVSAALAQSAGEIEATWAAAPFLTLRGHEYNAMWIGKDTLARVSPFLRIAELPRAAHPMGSRTFAVIGAKDGFYVLGGETHDDHAAHVDDLLDETCGSSASGGRSR